MLDEKDLQAISQLLVQQKSEILSEMDARFAQQKGEIQSEMDARFALQKGEIQSEMDKQFAQQRGEIQSEMDARFAQQKGEIQSEMDTRFVQQKGEMMHEVRLLMESYFDPKFNYLADGLELLKERTVSREEVEEITDRLDVLEAVIKVHSREIEKLKKAQ